jgi:hypothetical protein
MVAKRWIYLATEQKFFLSSPMFYASHPWRGITNGTDRRMCESVLLVAEATRLTWPQPMLLRLNELSQQP